MDADLWETLGPILGLIAGFGVLGGVVALALRHSRRSTEHLRARVTAFNDVMARAAEAGGLTYVASPDYAHPVVGPIPAHGRLSGVRDGLRVRIDMHSDYSPGDRAGGTVHARVRVTIDAPSERRFDRQLAADARRHLKAEHFHVEAIEDDALTILGPRGRGIGRYGQIDGLPDDPAELLALVDRALEGARAALR